MKHQTASSPRTQYFDAASHTTESKYNHAKQVKDIGVMELRPGMEVEVEVASGVFEEVW